MYSAVVVFQLPVMLISQVNLWGATQECNAALLSEWFQIGNGSMVAL